MRRNAKRFETWKRLFAVLIICAMMFTNVSGTIRAVESLGMETQAGENSEETVNEVAEDTETPSDPVEAEDPSAEEPAAEEPASNEKETPAQEEEAPPAE